ncbi:MAG: DUF4286 family protein [Dysgonomonas sp.]|nr:DUF4286 family protein [Dysgonomonas sp.]
MLIFNTTLHIEDSIHNECLEYLIQVYIPQSLSGNLLEQPSLARIERQHEESGISYAMQFKTHDIDSLNKWADEIGEYLQQQLVEKFGNKVTGFATLLEEIPLQ